MLDIIKHSVGELFCGPGGMALGFKSAEVLNKQAGELHNFELVWASDYDHWACETYRVNIGAHVVKSPVEELDFTSLPDVEGLIFGFPCNDFSIVGERKGISGYYGKLYKYAVKCIEEKAPLWFVAENVPGIKSAKGKKQKAIHDVIEEFAGAGPGYVVTAHTYFFEDYGVPQYRHRVIVVGFRKDSGLIFKVPTPTHIGRHVSAEEALRGVEAVPFNNEKPVHTKRVVKLLEFIPEGSNCWDPAVPEELRLNVKSCKISLIYRRLSRDKPSYTITGSGGGGTHVYHYAEPRALTNRERAKLQTFPDNFRFCGPKEAVRKQIGMAVPPAASKIIAESILKTICGIKYAHIQANLCEGVCDVKNKREKGVVVSGVAFL